MCTVDFKLAREDVLHTLADRMGVWAPDDDTPSGRTGTKATDDNETTVTGNGTSTSGGGGAGGKMNTAKVAPEVVVEQVESVKEESGKSEEEKTSGAEEKSTSGAESEVR